MYSYWNTFGGGSYNNTRLRVHIEIGRTVKLNFDLPTLWFSNNFHTIITDKIIVYQIFKINVLASTFVKNIHVCKKEATK